jgi:hypothetical protein
MALLVPTSSHRSLAGQRRHVHARLPAVSDADTWNTGLTRVEHVTLTADSDATVAADSIAVASVAAGVVTFQVAGTARAVYAHAVGI